MTPSAPYNTSRTRSIFAESVQAAMEEARVQIGPDALLVDSREAPPEARHLGSCEVIFSARSASDRSPTPFAGGETGAIREEISQIREMIAELRRSGPRNESAAQPARPDALENSLCDAGLERSLAAEIAEGVRRRQARSPVVLQRRAPVSPSEPAGCLRAEIESRITVDATIGRVAALVGPPGAGKTSTLVKLAVSQGLERGRPVRLLTVDTLRIGAADQLQTYAAILGVPFQSVETAAMLERAIDAAPPDALILIDTPGYTSSMLEEFGEEFTELFARRQDIDTHLILTATMRPRDLRRISDRFAPFRPAKLLFTRLDETTSMSSVLSEAARLGKPLSFFCGGPSVPEDLEVASSARVCDGLVSELPEYRQAVA